MRIYEDIRNRKEEYLKLKDTIKTYHNEIYNPDMSGSDRTCHSILADVNYDRLLKVGDNIHNDGKLTQEDITSLSAASAFLAGIDSSNIRDEKLREHYDNTVRMMNGLVKDSLQMFDEVTSQHLADWYSDRLSVKEKDEKSQEDTMRAANWFMLGEVHRYFDVYALTENLTVDTRNSNLQALFSLYNYMEGIEDTHRQLNGEFVAQKATGKVPDITEARKLRNQLETFRMFCKNGMISEYAPMWNLTPACKFDTTEVDKMSIMQLRDSSLNRILGAYSERMAECIKQLDPKSQSSYSRRVADSTRVKTFDKESIQDNLEVAAVANMTVFTDCYMEELDNIIKAAEKSKNNERRLPDVSGIETADVEDTCEFE